MGLSGPVWRLPPEAVEEKARLLRAAAADLSAQLGAGAAGQQEPAPDR
jgi:DNA-binding IclR family transcriptional regulator